MQSKQKINVDISRDRNLSEPSVYAKQNDSNSRKVEVTLFDSGIQLSSLAAPGKVFFGKGDNAYVETIQITNGVTEFIIPQNALSSSGRIQAEILILKDDDDTEALTSATFIINCHTQINPSGAIDGENKGDYIGRIVETIDSIVEKIEQIESSEMARTPLPDGAIDLNTLTSSAWWYTAEHRVSITNAPKNISELELIVTKDAISISQILISPTVDDSSIYFRFSHNNGVNWTNWQKSATDADISTLNETLRRIDNELDSKVSSVNGKNGIVTVTGADIPLEEGSQTIIGPFVTDLNNKFVKLNDDLEDKFTLIENSLDSKVSSVNGKNGIVTVTGADIPLEEGSQTIIGPFVTDLSNKFVKLNDDLEDKFTLIENTLDSKVSSVNGKNGTVTVTGADIPLEEGSQTLIGPYVNSINSSVLQMNDNLDKKVSLTNGTIQGSVNWNNLTKTGCYKIQNCKMTADYNAPVDENRFGVLQVLNSEWDTGTTDKEHRVFQIYIPHKYTLKYGIHIRSNNSVTGYNDWTDWVGFYNAKQVDLKLETKASVETGICTLTVSNGSVSNASYSKTGKDVTVNFWFYPDDTNEVVVSGLPYVATKNQSGIASASVGGVRVSYEMSKDNANATLYPETTSEQYCTLTYNLGAYNPQP